MKFQILFGCLALAWSVAAGAVEPAAPAPATTMTRDIQDLSDELRTVRDRIADLEKRMDEIEKRLGETYRASSPFNTIERRLEDLEKELDRR